MYHTEPPTDRTIREWCMNSSRVAACALRNDQAATLLEFMYHSRIVNAIFLHDYPLALEPGSTPRSLVQKILERFSTY